MKGWERGKVMIHYLLTTIAVEDFYVYLSVAQRNAAGLTLGELPGDD